MLAAFHRNRARSDGRQSTCKECQRAYVREHYARQPEYYKAKALESTRERRDSIRQMIRSAKDRPCADCGKSYPYYVMDFDHIVGKKRFDVGRGLSNRTVADIEEEIAKCEVVCANCHREREHLRRNSLS